MTAELRIGDVFDLLADVPDGSVDLVVTSPPFLALRSYLPADHPDKGKEIGSEATPADFLDTLLRLSVEWRRVLAPHGSLCVELGDTYAGSGGAGGDYLPGGPGGVGWPLPKSLTGVPTLYAWSLAYGRNLLRPEHTFDPWRIRNLLVWARPNPPVGALGDKFRPAVSYITVACVGSKRWFDLDAVRLPLADSPGNRYVRKVSDGDRQGRAEATVDIDRETNKITADYDPTESGGAPPLDWQNDLYDGPTGDRLWVLLTQPYPGAHYATFPEALPRRLIEAMCPQRVCRTCGKPSRRLLSPVTLNDYRDSDRPQTRRAVELADAAGLTDEHIQAVMARGISEGGKAAVVSTGNGRNSADVQRLADEAKEVLGGYVREFTQTTTSKRGFTWSDCAHDDWRNGLTLDPFAGSSTTLQVATELGRDSLGFDLDERNALLAVDRCGMFLGVTR